MIKLNFKSEIFEFESPIGEPNLRYTDKYYIERSVNSLGETVWYGIAINWKKVKGGVWTVLSTNENAKPLEKYLPDIVYGDDRTYWKPCEMPIYEQMYQKYYCREDKLNRILKK